MPSLGALDSGNPDNEDDANKAARLAARAARFNNKLVGNRYKELEEARIRERKAYEQQGLISAGKTELGEAVDMRGTCERMCSAYEAEYREYTNDVHPLEMRKDQPPGDKRRIDHDKAVAMYTRSDAGAGHGEAAKLPSDLRTPVTLSRTLDYLFSDILPRQSEADPPAHPTPRTALGYTAGFIRDRTRAIRKEFAMQSSWGHAEAIDSFERIARWHILCLRELQEESGMNVDMHIDSAELGRCFTSLRQHYDDRREELGVDMPCPNEPEFRAYMLIFDLTNKNAAITTAEAPSIILDHPNVQLAWQLRRAAQRNFDSQKEGSKQNAELGANLITAYTRLLRSAPMPYLLSCLAEIRLREMRRSALRALQRTYPRLKGDPIRRGEDGQVLERKMVLMSTFGALMGCEEQEAEESAWDDVEPVARTPEAEGADIARRFGLEVYEENGQPVGVLINQSVFFDDNKDAPYTRRWKLITERRGSISYTDIINGKAGIVADSAARVRDFAPATRVKPQQLSSSNIFSQPATVPTSFFSNSHKLSAESISRPADSSSPAATKSFFSPAPAPPTTTKPAAVPTPSTSSSAQPTPFSFATPASRPPSSSLPSTAATGQTPAFSFNMGKGTTSTSNTSATALPTSASPAKPPLFSFNTAAATPADTAPTSPAPARGESAVPAIQPFSFPTSSIVPPTLSRDSASPAMLSERSTPLAGPSSPSLTQSTSGTPHKASLRSLTRSVLRSVSSPKKEAQRRSRQHTATLAAETLIDEVLLSLITGITPEISQAINNEVAARAYQDRKGKRRETISQWSEEIFDRLLQQAVEEIAREAVRRETNKRARVKRTSELWVEWTHERQEERAEVEKDRKEIWERLRDMGLGRSTSSAIREGTGAGSVVKMEEMEIDVKLHEAERDRERFYSPSTFLHIIARHTSLVLAPPPRHDDDSPLARFQILLSSSADAASPIAPSTRKWLITKLQPKQSDDDWWACDGVNYACRVKSRYDDLPEADLNRVGVVLLEVPMSSALNQERESNIADVHDRLRAVEQLRARHSCAYDPALIVLTWQEETLAEVQDRLCLQPQLQQWRNVQLMSLSRVDGVEDRFERVVKAALKTSLVRKQLILDISAVTTALEAPWRRWLDSTALLLRQEKGNAEPALFAFQSGIDLLNKISDGIKSWLKAHSDSKSSPSFAPIALPPFEADQAVDIPTAVGQLESYLENDMFAVLQDVQLAGALLKPSSQRNEPLPISIILSAISAFIFGELTAEHLLLELYGDEGYVKARQAEFVATIMQDFSTRVETAIRDLAALAPSPVSPVGDHTAAKSPTSKSKSSSSASGWGRSLKRPASGEVSPTSKESKSSKNARLREAIRAVEQSLQDIGADDLDTDQGRDGAEILAFQRMSRAETELGLSY